MPVMMRAKAGGVDGDIAGVSVAVPLGQLGNGSVKQRLAHPPQPVGAQFIAGLFGDDLLGEGEAAPLLRPVIRVDERGEALLGAPVSVQPPLFVDVLPGDAECLELGVGQTVGVGVSELGATVRHMSNLVSPRMSPQARREHIVSVASEHFARDGVTGASMSAVAKDAGVGRALVYHYFPGKEALLEAVLRAESDRLLEATAPLPDVTMTENVTRALAAFFDHFAASSGGVRELYTASPTSAPSVTGLAAANHVIQVERLLSGARAPDTARNRLALGAWLAFVEYTARHLNDDSSSTPREVAVDLCLNALKTALDRPSLD